MDDRQQVAFLEESADHLAITKIYTPTMELINSDWLRLFLPVVNQLIGDWYSGEQKTNNSVCAHINTHVHAQHTYILPYK